MRRSIVKVYGVAKGAGVSGRDPGQRHIRPAYAADPQPEVPGEPLGKFKITARLIAELYPQLTNARR
jgi:hypothetical protein